MRRCRSMHLGLLALLIAAGLAQADVAALKRSPGLTIDMGLDAAFQAAIANGTLAIHSGPTAAIDADLYDRSDWATQYRYANTGTNAAVRQHRPLLSKFDVGSLPGFLGSRVTKAQLRFYYGSGNNGLETTGYITSSDWVEGDKGTTTGTGGDGDYPGKVSGNRGVSMAHPMGRNTDRDQNSEGGTTPPLMSWANDDFWSPVKDGGDLTTGRTMYSYPGTLPDGKTENYDGFAVMDVTAIVQRWASGTPNYGFYTVRNATDFTNNYTVQLSETLLGPDFQPVLFVNYEPNAAPNAVTDLAVAGKDWFRIDLRWTAPSDVPPGPVARYEIRCSTTEITEANFNDATLLADVPTPAAPGTVQTLSVTDVASATRYYFAIRCWDVADLSSPLSNVVSEQTNPVDAVAPAAIGDLAVVTTKPNYAVLRWTAVGDDGVTGVAASYDLRYSNEPITDANWDAATPVAGVPAPQLPGQTETFTVRGLAPSTQYYFAIRARDEVPNPAPASNLAVTTTLAADPYPPAQVTDLKVAAAHIRVVYLVWTAPADIGTAEMGGYDVRYSTSPIDASNWDLATQVQDEPAPSLPGTYEHLTVAGLNADTTYYFAMKSWDLAEPANISPLSNVASVRTMPAVPPITVRNPWIVNNRVADTYSLATMGQTFTKAYTPDGVIEPVDDEAKAINIYNNIKRRCYHWANVPPYADDPTYNFNVFGWGLCGHHQSMATSVCGAAGMVSRSVGINEPPYGGHNIYEVQYGDGTWHLFDTMTTMYVYNRADPRRVASAQEIAADRTIMTLAEEQGRACPGYLLCGDDEEWFANGLAGYTTFGPANKQGLTMRMDLRIGDSILRTCESWANQHPPMINSPGKTGPPYHHEAARDDQDYVNFPYWEPYALDSLGNSQIGISYSRTYRRWANGTYVIRPDFRSAACQAAIDPASTGIATFHDDAISPDLHVADVAQTGEAIFTIRLPFYMTDAALSGTFVRTNASDICRIWTWDAANQKWVAFWNHTAIGITEVVDMNLRNAMFGKFEYKIKIELKATSAKTDVGVSNLVIRTTFEHNKGGMAYLDKGVNNIKVTFDNPDELAASGASFKVTYKWKEYDGTGWTIDRVHEQYCTGAETNFTITVGGDKVPRTEYILMEVTEPPVPDNSAPAPVRDLHAYVEDSTRIGLQWTAPGDDFDLGQAAAYDLRVSPTPITADNFDDAAGVAGVPAPKAAGLTERFIATGLEPSTVYYFALKTRDEAGNVSDISNLVVATTGAQDLTPPAAVTDLRAAPGSAKGSLVLIWTAVGDDGHQGQASTYEIRYSTDPITPATFGTATLVTGAPAPQLVGSAETLTVTGLNWNQRYYFAMKVHDEVPLTSGLSNITHAVTDGLGTVILQYGLNGFTSTRDAYMYVGQPTTPYGTTGTVRVCGFGTGNWQRGLIQFGLSSIPPSVRVSRATFSLYTYKLTQIKGTTGEYGLYRLTRDWSESGCTWSSAGGANWTTPGGDFESTPDVTVPRHSTIAVGWYDWDVTDRVAQWVSSGGAGNFGWCIKLLDEAGSSQDEFAPLEYATAELRPKLVVSDGWAPTIDGDLDADGEVSVLDIVAVVTRFGTVPGDENWLPEADCDADGEVSVLDVVFVVTRFGNTQ